MNLHETLNTVEIVLFWLGSMAYHKRFMANKKKASRAQYLRYCKRNGILI